MRRDSVCQASFSEANDELVLESVHWVNNRKPEWYLGDMDPHCTVVGGYARPTRKDKWSLGRWPQYANAVAERTLEKVCNH